MMCNVSCVNNVMLGVSLYPLSLSTVCRVRCTAVPPTYWMLMVVVRCKLAVPSSSPNPSSQCEKGKIILNRSEIQCLWMNIHQQSIVLESFRMAVSF